MKKIGFTLLSAMLISQAIHAQATYFAGVSGSVNTVGYTYQNNYGQTKLGYDGAQISPFFSLFGGVDFNKSNQLLLEASFANYHTNYKDDITVPPSTTAVTYKKDVKLNYFSIPLLYRFVAGAKKSSGAKFFLTVGPQFSFLTSASYSLTIAGTNAIFTDFAYNPYNPSAESVVATNTNGGTTQPAAKDLYKSSSIDAVFGFGALFPLSDAVKLSAELRGGYGLGDINADKWHTQGYESKAVVDYKASHSYFGGLRIGLQYSFGKKK